MPISVVEDLHCYNSMVRGLRWWVSLDKTCPEDSAITYCAEGCKQRIKLLNKIQLLDYLLEKELFTISSLKIDEVLGHVPYQKAKASSIDSVAGQIRKGLEMLLYEAKVCPVGNNEISKMWPDCISCPPRGYNCMLTLSGDFLDTFSDVFFFCQSVSLISDELSKRQSQKEISHSEIGTDFRILSDKMKMFQEWTQGDIINKLEFDVLDEIIDGKRMEEWILYELSQNLKTWEKLHLSGWPVVINGKHRCEFVEDNRGKLIDVIVENYKNEDVQKKFLFINNIIERLQPKASIEDKELCLKEFLQSDAKFIDPITTAFVLKFLTFVYASKIGNQDVADKHFRNHKEIIENCIETILFLKENSINRNDVPLLLDFEGKSKEIFKGNSYPPSDGIWMNCENSPLPFPSHFLPDYSLSSTLDIATTLMFMPIMLKELDESLTKSIDEMNSTLSNYVIEQRLNKALEKKNGLLNRLEISHWQDRYHTRCPFSDIYGTTKILDYLLNLMLTNAIKGKCDESRKLLFDTAFAENLEWLVHQQETDGYWPPASTAMLELSMKDDSVFSLFSPYLRAIGLSKDVRDMESLKEAMKRNKPKTMSFINTSENIGLLSKYYTTRIILSILG